MHVFLVTGRLCLQNWKKLIPWVIYGPSLFVVYGAGSGMGNPTNWGALIAIGVIFGVYVGILVQINGSRVKKNQSLKKIDRDVRDLSEGDLHIAFIILGALFGIFIARLLSLPLVGYAISVAIVISIGLSRRIIEKILP